MGGKILGPDLSLETPFLTHGQRVAGVDEAGRGPWAGPVIAAAVVLDVNTIPDGINDSKKLSQRQRGVLAEAIKQQALAVGIGMASVEEIDELNILSASKLAMQRAVNHLEETPHVILVDGNQPPVFPCHVESVVKGDSISLSIAAASIIAKTTRDRIMCDIAKQYPEYGFESNAGYGTKTHQAALQQLGPTEHHRKSFAPIKKLLAEREFIE